MEKKTLKKKRVSAKRPSRAKKPALVFVPSEIKTDSVAHGHSVHHHNIKPHASGRFDERSQKLVMWLGISAIMTAVIVLWILNLNRIVGADSSSAAGTEKTTPNSDFQQLSRDLKQTLSEVRTGLEKLETPVVSDVQKPSLITETTFPNTLPN